MPGLPGVSRALEIAGARVRATNAQVRSAIDSVVAVVGRWRDIAVANGVGEDERRRFADTLDAVPRLVAPLAR